jgi:hypothetical protein
MQNETASVDSLDGEVDGDNLAVQLEPGSGEVKSALADGGSDGDVSEECQISDRNGGDHELNVPSMNAHNKQGEKITLLEVLLADPAEDTDFDTLRRRLKQAEQCFSGRLHQRKLPFSPSLYVD